MFSNVPSLLFFRIFGNCWGFPPPIPGVNVKVGDKYGKNTFGNVFLICLRCLGIWGDLNDPPPTHYTLVFSAGNIIGVLGGNYCFYGGNYYWYFRR